MRSNNRKDLSESQKKFIQWLLDEDVKDDSELEGILTVDEHSFLQELKHQPYYYFDERAELKKIISKNEKLINSEYKKYLNK